MSTINQVSSGRFARVLCAAALSTLSLGYASDSFAGATFKIDDTKWVSVGAGLRTDFRAQEEAAPNGNTWSNDFKLDSVRLYVNGQIHKYLKYQKRTTFCNCTDGCQVPKKCACYKYNNHLINPTYDKKLHSSDDQMIAIQPRTQQSNNRSFTFNECHPMCHCNKDLCLNFLIE